MKSLLDKISDRDEGICLYGIAPPKRATEPAALDTIARQQIERVERLGPDGLIVYDIQDESERTAAPRPFPFLPTLSPDVYAEVLLRTLETPKIVYRAVTNDSRKELIAWLEAVQSAAEPRLSVLVGAPSGRLVTGRLKLDDAYALAAERAPRLVLGGIAIAERHQRTCDEHQRMIAKMDKGCRFLVTQAVYDVTSTKSLLSDYALALAGRPAVPVIVTFSPCGSPRTLEFMKWLGVSFPRWLENELRHSTDILARSVALSTAIFGELLDYAREKRIPLGINVESVSIRKAEIDASVELYHALRALIAR